RGMAGAVAGGRGIWDETSPLRQVIVHRPGPELERLTPETRERFLFDEVLWRDRAATQHDLFTSLLRSRGVEVLELTALLIDLLEHPPARHELLRAALEPAILGDIAVQDLSEEPTAMPSQALGDVLVAGITRAELRELGEAPRAMSLHAAGQDDRVRAP